LASGSQNRFVSSIVYRCEKPVTIVVSPLWCVAKQREQYKLLQKKQHSFLTPYRQEKLNSAGFVWVVRAGMDSDVRNVKLEASAASAGDGEDGTTSHDNDDALGPLTAAAAAIGADGNADESGAVKMDPESLDAEEKEDDKMKEVYNV
jgi:hypothetical protein